ncbi:TatD DNase family protein [Limnobacter thiooxidans]|uniref:TatD family hydrolase n=1 Tax=Limnobacter thiooxidans TaxID=131080 RepID=A0AA86J6X7_9BURK|nr:TatD DNase family protein [Limnobacter thiooxidans]BET26060.1 TatD family hydrolase [Limnobacter thiooxidans]
MFTDSHCHLDFPGLVEQLPDILSRMKAAQVSRALCISVQLEDFPNVLALAENHDNLWATAGVHPDYEDITEPTVEKLLQLADHARVIGIGETGLDYFRLKGDLEWQRERFRVHLRAANVCKKPVIVHTRAAGDDTLRILEEENVQGCGGVIHCFTETLDFARKALDLGMYLSFSGIVSFKNAADLREVARFAPLDRILIETDSPYLAPVPHRGKTNEPSFVPHVAKVIAMEKAISIEEVGIQTSSNFDKLFGLVQTEDAAA